MQVGVEDDNWEEEELAVDKSIGKAGKRGERPPLLEIEENEHDGAGKKKAKAEGGEAARKRGGQLHNEMGAAASAAVASADDGMGGGAADDGVGDGDGMGSGEASSVAADIGGGDGGGVLAERTESHAAGGGITMEATRALFDQKLGPMAAEMHQMRGEVGAIRTMVQQEELVEVNGRIGRL